MSVLPRLPGVQRGERERRARQRHRSCSVGAIGRAHAAEILGPLLDRGRDLRAHVVFARHHRAEGARVIGHRRDDHRLPHRAPARAAHDAHDVRWHSVQQQVLRRNDLHIEVGHHQRSGIDATLLHNRHSVRSPALQTSGGLRSCDKPGAPAVAPREVVVQLSNVSVMPPSPSAGTKAPTAMRGRSRAIEVE